MPAACGTGSPDPQILGAACGAARRLRAADPESLWRAPIYDRTMVVEWGGRYTAEASPAGSGPAWRAAGANG